MIQLYIYMHIYRKVIQLYIYTYIHIIFYILFHYGFTGYWIFMLYSRTLLFIHSIYNGLPLLIPNWASLVAQTVKKICLQCRRPRFDPWVGKVPWRRAWQPTPVFLPGESHGQRSLVGYNPQGHKESDTTEQLRYIIPKLPIHPSSTPLGWIIFKSTDEYI